MGTVPQLDASSQRNIGGLYYDQMMGALARKCVSPSSPFFSSPSSFLYILLLFFVCLSYPVQLQESFPKRDLEGSIRRSRLGKENYIPLAFFRLPSLPSGPSPSLPSHLLFLLHHPPLTHKKFTVTLVKKSGWTTKSKTTTTSPSRTES